MKTKEELRKEAIEADKEYCGIMLSYLSDLTEEAEGVDVQCMAAALRAAENMYESLISPGKKDEQVFKYVTSWERAEDGRPYLWAAREF